jgi:hypothetical protein
MGNRESTYRNSTQVSASNLNVPVRYPLGGWLHARAMIRVSTSPVVFGGTGGVSRFLRCKKAVIYRDAQKSFLIF